MGCYSFHLFPARTCHVYALFKTENVWQRVRINSPRLKTQLFFLFHKIGLYGHYDANSAPPILIYRTAIFTQECYTFTQKHFFVEPVNYFWSMAKMAVYQGWICLSNAVLSSPRCAFITAWSTPETHPFYVTHSFILQGVPYTNNLTVPTLFPTRKYGTYQNLTFIQFQYKIQGMYVKLIDDWTTFCQLPINRCTLYEFCAFVWRSAKKIHFHHHWETIYYKYIYDLTEIMAGIFVAIKKSNRKGNELFSYM